MKLKDIKQAVRMLSDEWDLGRGVCNGRGDRYAMIYIMDVLSCSDRLVTCHVGDELIGFAGYQKFGSIGHNVSKGIYWMAKNVIKLTLGRKKIKALREYYNNYNYVPNEAMKQFDGELSILFVNKRYRHKGVAKDMMNYLLGLYRENEECKLCIMTDESCDYGFYDSIGCEKIYETEVTNYEKSRIGDRLTQNAYVYCKRINGGALMSRSSIVRYIGSEKMFYDYEKINEIEQKIIAALNNVQYDNLKRCSICESVYSANIAGCHDCIECDGSISNGDGVVLPGIVMGIERARSFAEQYGINVDNIKRVWEILAEKSCGSESAFTQDNTDMKKLLNYVKNSNNTADMCIALLQFERGRMFCGGNGIVGRLVFNDGLRNNIHRGFGYISISREVNKRLSEYNKLVNETIHVSGFGVDVTAFVQFMMECTMSAVECMTVAAREGRRCGSK